MRPVSTLLLLLFCCAPALAQDNAQPVLAVDVTSDVAEAPTPAPTSYIVLKDGQMLGGAVKLMPSADKARYAVYNGERFELSEIKLIQTPEGAFGVARSPQLGTSMLMHQTMSGRISVYEEQGLYSSGIQFFQKDEGEMLMVNQENLHVALSDNPESMEYLRRHSSYQKIGYASLIAGAAMVATGAALQFSGYKASSTLASPPVIAASGVLLATSVNFVIPVFQRRATEQALRAYNH